MHARVEPTEVRLPDPTGLTLDEPEARTATFVISTSARDSHHTVLNQAAWDLKRYHRNPIVGYQHEVWGPGMCNPANPDVVIGTSRVAVEDGQRLVAVATFEPREINELAEKIWRKIHFGSMRATSVGFREIGAGRWGEDDEAEGGKRETYYFEGQELYEWSICNMGSNPETVKRDASTRARAFVTRAVASMRSLGEDVTTDDVMRMTVSEALSLFDGSPRAAPFRSASRAERRAKAVEFIRGAL